jgi:hypothetical protein
MDTGRSATPGFHMYRMHRVFCATAWELEAERSAFYDVIGQFNEMEAMRCGMLYVPVSLTNVHDKRPLQYVVDQNIRDCRHYILAIDEDWGPKERNFERDYRLAAECVADSSLPMHGTAILLRARPDGMPSPFAANLAGAGLAVAEFADTRQFSDAVRSLLTEWMPGDVALPASTAPA